MSSERDPERRIPDDNERRRDYPKVQFTLVGDEGKSPEELEKEIQILLLKRDLALLFLENGIPEPNTDQEPEPKPDSAE